MRNFFTSSLFALVLFLGATGAAPVAHAQSTCTQSTLGKSCALGDGSTGICRQNPEDGSYGCGVQVTNAAAGTYGAQASEAQKAAEKSATDNKANDDDKYNFVMIKIMSLFAWLVGVAAITLDNAVYYTVVAMGDYVNNLSAVGVAWRILRDLGNILLIFGFLAIGITTILNVEWYGGGKKMLPKLVLAAVFLNFSLFMTEAVIDVGNLFATQFYTQINGGQAAGAKTLFESGSVSNEGISNKIMGQLGLQDIYGSATRNTLVFKGANPWFIGFMGILLFIVTAFVLFSLAFILIARFVILLYLIILAPVGFAGFAIPQLESAAKKWRDTLVEQVLTAPVLLLTLYVALAVITDVNFLTGFGTQGASWTDFTTTGKLAGFASLMISFLVAMGLLLAVTIFAKKLSAFGASGAMKLAGGVTIGATAWAGRGAVGTVIGRGLLGNRLIKRGAVSDNSLVKYGSRLASFTGKRLQNRTFDVRNMPGAKAGLGMMGVEAGTPSALTAKQLQEKQYGVKPTVEWFRNASKEYEKEAKELDLKAALAAATLPTIPPNPASIAAQKELKKMSVDELAQLKNIRGGIDRLVFNLSPEKYNELMKGSQLLAGEKKKLKDKWEEQFNATNATTTISRLSTEEVGALGGETLVKPDVVEALGSNEFDFVRRKGTLTRDQRHAIFDRMTSPAASPALTATVRDYFDPANDIGGARQKYWNV